MQDVHALVLRRDTAWSFNPWRILVLNPLQMEQGLEQAVIVERQEPGRAPPAAHVRVELLRLEDELEALQGCQVNYHVVPAAPVVPPAGTVRGRLR